MIAFDEKEMIIESLDFSAFGLWILEAGTIEKRRNLKTGKRFGDQNARNRGFGRVSRSKTKPGYSLYIIARLRISFSNVGPRKDKKGANGELCRTNLRFLIFSETPMF